MKNDKLSKDILWKLESDVFTLTNEEVAHMRETYEALPWYQKKLLRGLDDTIKKLEELAENSPRTTVIIEDED